MDLEFEEIKKRLKFLRFKNKDFYEILTNFIKNNSPFKKEVKECLRNF
jgi:hypothetical protein